MTGIPVVFCADSSYLPHFATALTSLLENNQGEHSVFLVSSDISEGSLSEFQDHVLRQYGCSLKLIRMNGKQLEGFPVSGHLSPIAYARAFLGDLLPEHCEWILYLDSDLVVQGEIFSDIHSVIQSQKIGKWDSPSWVFAVREGTGKHLQHLGFSSGTYFNSGVMVLNARGWRESGVSQSITALAEAVGDRVRWWDQDLFNLHFESSWGRCPRVLTA